MVKDKNDALFLVSLPFGQKTIPYDEVPELIAKAKSPSYDREKASGGHEDVIFALSALHEEGLFKAAVLTGEVEVLSKSLHRMGLPFIGRLENTVLTVRALREYVESIQGFLEIEDAPAPQPTTPSLAPVVAASDGPAPLTTGDIAHCFNGLRWSEKGWRKPLGDKPKWLDACVAISGERGVRETRWNPVLIGAALVQQGHVKARSVRAKFQTVDLLRPWLDVWKTYEADNFDSE